MITISIVEDHDQFRNTLEIIIRGQNDFGLIKSYSTAENAMHDLPENPPDIVIVDITLPGMKGTELITKLKTIMPQTQFMVAVFMMITIQFLRH